MAFEHDIFISYAHIDNLVIEAEQEGWIDHFHRALKIRLAQLRGEQPKIWRDRKLQGNDYFSDTILEQFPKVALLVSVLSPRYLKSEWCLRELQHFYAAANQAMGVRVADKSRIFKVIKTEVPHEKHPDILQPLIGYPFYEVDDGGRPREFSPIFGVESRNKYLAKLDDLAYDICKTLEALETARSASPATAEPAAPQPDKASSPADKATPQADEAIPPADKAASQADKAPPQTDKQIYLAEAPKGLEDERDHIRRDLELKGYQVLPGEPLPDDPDEFSQAVQDYLQTSNVSVHLITHQPAAGTSIAQVFRQMAFARSQEQIQLAAQASLDRPDFSRILWLPPADQPLDTYLQTLQDDPDFLSTSIEDLKTFIQDRLDRPTVSTMTNGSLKVLLDCDEEDINAPEIEPLYAYLDQQFEVELPDYKDGGLAASETLLRQCDAVLIYYGHGNGLWLKRRLLALKKTFYGRIRPLQAQAVYVAAPHKHASADIPVIQGVNQFSPTVLEPFLAQVAQGGR
ncbi:MAG: toll/interleukin-1 receptor domain-containing protein [Leptolyngbyaceae cyanobacterium MO_188.B28]|nr:toll/interleukin-1 receptor domain-containing protein [Leptolyngbyaceae cyanobacterium MO_188.B28]